MSGEVVAVVHRSKHDDLRTKGNSRTPKNNHAFRPITMTGSTAC